MPRVTRFAVSVTCYVLASCCLHAQVNVLTANYGNDRTNANLAETVLNTGNVTPGTFGKLGSFPVDGQIYAQPLFVSGLNIAGQQRDVVFVATMRNSVYAFDAGTLTTAAPLWRVNFGAAVSSDFLDFDDIDPEVGILSTPVIDPGSNTLYLVANTFEKGDSVYRLHALDLLTGAEKPGSPVEIKGAVRGTGDSSDGTTVSFVARQHLQRPGLLLQSGRIYIAFGSHADTFPYHGWIFAYRTDNLQTQAGVFNATPNGSSGSIWQSGRGLASDADGNLYVGTANGDYDGETSFSESFLKLSPDLKLLDWFTPFDWQRLSERDRDLGSLGPVMIPGTTKFFGGDKFGNLYLIDTQQMGHLGVEGAESPQTVRPVQFGGIFTTALWMSDAGPLVYLSEMSDWTGSLRMTDGKFETDLHSQSLTVASDIPYQGMAISASGGAAGTGILWMTTGDHQQDGVPGTLHAFDAMDLTNEIWNSGQNPDRDAMGGFAKFVSPTIANGRVYVPTFSNQLNVYGLLPEDGGPPAGVEATRSPVKRVVRPARAGQVRATPKKSLDK